MRELWKLCVPRDPSAPHPVVRPQPPSSPLPARQKKPLSSAACRSQPAALSTVQVLGTRRMLSFLRCWGTRVSLQGCWGRDKLEQEAWGFWCRTVSLAEGGAAWWSLEESPRLPGVISALGAPRKAAGPLPCAGHCQLTGKPGSPGLAGACRNRGGATAPGLRARAPGRHTREHFLFCVSVPEGLVGGEGAGKGPGDPPLFLRCSLSS